MSNTQCINIASFNNDGTISESDIIINQGNECLNFVTDDGEVPIDPDIPGAPAINDEVEENLEEEERRRLIIYIVVGILVVIIIIALIYYFMR